MIDSPQDKRVSAWMDSMWSRVYLLDSALEAKWDYRAKSRPSRRVNHFSPETWYESQPVPTARKKMFLPRKMAAVGYYSSLKINHRRRPAA